jgi:acyl-coenzyme A synthetase/AMP-(fatty) acid ligase
MVLTAEGRPVAPGETGILHVRGPHVMLGYWKRPELTARTIREGAWPGDRVLCTHDRFTVDEEGFLYFVGRSDDIIKSRGEKVSPAEVEAVLYAMDGVTAAAVVGVPDALLGVSLDATALRRHCAERLEMHQVPQRVIVCDALPVTPNGKIDRRRLALRVSDGSEAAV